MIEGTPPIVMVQGLVKDYGEFRAVDGMDFRISAGECFGFLGPNGAGKTTVMRVISCFLPPTSGSVTVFGREVTREPSAIKARMGVMPQEDNLDLDLSVIDNLIVYARYFDIPKKTSAPLAATLLAFVELHERGKAKIKDLSGGMKRRLMLARALVNSPELMILDEPTTGLDPHSRHAVWERLNHLKSRNTTLLLTTHYMEEAERLCDRVAIIDRGKVVTVDAPQVLMERHGGDNLEQVYLKLTGRSLEY
ncbi:MAG: ABC transporter ATP-binding protein [Thermodesulfobacteriota bacterium]